LPFTPSIDNSIALPVYPEKKLIEDWWKEEGGIGERGKNLLVKPASGTLVRRRYHWQDDPEADGREGGEGGSNHQPKPGELRVRR